MLAPIAPGEFMLGYDYLDWRAAQTPFESMGAWSGVGDCDLTDTAPTRHRCARVDAGLLPSLGVQPVLGRNFSADDDRPNAAKVVLISNGLWRGRFGGEPGVIGRQVPVDGQPSTIVGVLPPEFEMPTLEPVELLTPLALDPAEQKTRRSAVLLRTIARLKSGGTPEQAAAALRPLFEEALQSVPAGFRKDVRLQVRSLRDRQIQDTRRASWILLGAVLAVLLIACANVANLLLARGAVRQREMAVRAALGAGRGRLIRQTFAESALLALAGGMAGCALAFVMLRVFVTLAPEGIPRLHQAGLDARVLLFALAISLLSGIAFGLAPAMQSPRAEALSGWRSVGARHHLFRQVLASAQVCASLMLLTGASLLLLSFWNLTRQPLGMRTDSVLTLTVTLGRKDYSEPARRAAFFDAFEERLRRIPGVTGLAIADSLPPTGNQLGSTLYATIDVKGRPRFTGGTGGPVVWRTITPEYFSVLGIPMLRGRPFLEQDRGADQDAVILSDALARRMFPGEDPLGKQIQPGRSGPWRTVIGVAADVRNAGLQEPGDPEFYLVRKHGPDNVGRSATAILRGAMDPAALTAWARNEVSALDASLPVTAATLEQRVSRLAERPRFNALLLGTFAAMGLLLAAIGLYGVISFLVAQRTAEIGVRMALGATPASVARMVLGYAGRATAAGAACGLAGSYFAARLLQSMLFGVSAHDPWIPAAVLALLCGVALLSAWIPSRRAARVDPIQALRQE
jgi:predicted permease